MDAKHRRPVRAAVEIDPQEDREPLFTVERREIVGRVFEGRGQQHPLIVGLTMIGEAISEAEHQVSRYTFTYLGTEYVVTSGPAN